MKKYHKLVKFIPYLEDPNTKWLDEDAEFHFFYASYSELGYELIDAIAELTEGPGNTYKVLEKYNLNYDEIDFENFNYEDCNLDLAFAILGVILRKERFCAGEISGMIKRGYVLKLIKVLEKNNPEVNYEIVSIRGERSKELDLFGVTVFVRANNQYYYFDFYGNLVQGRPTGKRGDIPLGNWFIDIRDFTEQDYEDYPEFVKGIEKYFKER